MTQKGYSLIEVCVVLLIIGLIVGGVLVGKDLVSAAAVRAQLAQIEKYNSATRAFYSEYQALPGDIPAATVTQLQFSVVPTRSGSPAFGDGNGLIEGYDFYNSTVADGVSSTEAAWFWEDLSSNTHLIEGSFNTAGTVEYPASFSTTRIGEILPQAKIGNGNYLCVVSSGNQNYFALETVGLIDLSGAINNGVASGTANPGITVMQAYAMDKKVDDGLPQTGNVLAQYENWHLDGYPPGVVWAAGGGSSGATGTAATPGTSSTCYDNGNVNGATQQYSITTSGGTATSCGLMFRFQ